jgi:hypothetical protein
MRYLAIVLILFFSFPVLGQYHFSSIQVPSIVNNDMNQNFSFIGSTTELVNFPKDVKLMAIASADGYFHRTYLIDQENESISSGFMPSPYFRPNNNLIVITGKRSMPRDSFNPYGADDLPSFIFFGTVNNFISRIKINRR